jgi:hypothetical protein
MPDLAAVALEAAIDRFGVQATDGDDVTHRLTALLTARTALRTAIAAYAEAEVARRLIARPTPDEARRLVEEFEQACDAFQYREADARTTARAALIAALVGKDP